MHTPREETEARMNEWTAAFQQLPEPRRRAVAQWFLAQRLTAQALGVSEGEWWARIERAMQHPGGGATAGEPAVEPSELDQADDSRRALAREALGSKQVASCAAGPGIAQRAVAGGDL